MDDLALNDHGERELVLGYVPTLRGEQDWQPVFRHEHVTSAGSVVRRVTWRQAADRDSRLLVDVAECRTSNTARSRLEAIMSDSNLPFVEGPARLGRGARVNAERERGSDKPRPVDPSSVYFMRSNLLIWVLSCGQGYCDVLACADRIVADLDAAAPLDADEDLVLKRQSDSPNAPGAICLSMEPKWERGEWAWYKFTAQGGTLTRAADRDRLLLWPAPGHQEAKVSGWVMEPGRKTYRGQYVHKS